MNDDVAAEDDDEHEQEEEDDGATRRSVIGLEPRTFGRRDDDLSLKFSFRFSSFEKMQKSDDECSVWVLRSV